jgi:hypothetical protein
MVFHLFDRERADEVYEELVVQLVMEEMMEDDCHDETPILECQTA